jgi:hypothetical protein
VNNRTLTAVLIVGILASSNVFASRARQAVMGTADPFSVVPSGTLYYDDALNIFYNPSYANDFKNWAAIEKANKAAAGTSDAEGGFVMSLASFKLGAYMNRVEGINTGPGLTTAYTYNDSFRPIDLIFAADLGIKMGVGLSYGGFKATVPLVSEAKDWTLRAGAQISGFEPFVNIKFYAKEVTAGIEGTHSGFTLGTRYKWGEWIPFVALRHDNLKLAGVTTKSSVLGGGFGRNTKLSKAARFNYALSGWRDTNANRYILPIDFSVESDLTTWMTGRAGFSYRLWDRTSDLSNAVGTTGRLGMTFHSDQIAFDWAIGGGGAVGAGDVDFPTFDLSGGLFAAASLSYHW